MNKFYLLLIVTSLFIAGNCPAQDIILRASGDEIPAKIIEITPTAIRYKNPDSLQGRTFTLPRQEEILIKYPTGARELLPPHQSADTLAAVVRTPQEWYQQGRLDSRLHYTGKGVFWSSVAAGTAATFTAGVSLAIPIILAVTPPQSLNIPDQSQLQNKDYLDGYKAQARKRKIGKSAAGAGVGSLVSVAAATIIVISVLNNM